MSRPRTPLLSGYRALTQILSPAAPLLMRQRLKVGKEDPARLGERRGFASIARPEGALVWAHGASVGEVLAIIPLVERIVERGFRVLLTSGTVTSAGLAAARLPKGAVHQYVPLDAPAYVRRFVKTWRPGLALFAESDLWPNLIAETHKAGAPLILVNGRISDRSFARWKRVRSTIQAMLSQFDLLLAQTERDADRFLDLGAPRVAQTGNIKLDVPAPGADPIKLAMLREAIGTRPVLAAASTHPGEEATVAAAHAQLRARFPRLLTIIAPRHPDRGPAIVETMAQHGLQAVQRTRAARPDAGTDVYVADTIGELGLLYRLAPVVFVGGSLVRHGGQNPIEPAKLGTAILHGPHVWNFSTIYEALDARHGAVPVEDAGTLAANAAALLENPVVCAHVTNQASAVVEEQSGAMERTFAALEPYLMQLHLEGRMPPG
jgi:3-deoxy-D-manno-octulosonic-acid transferase